jgi:hypothetical protein
LPFLGRIHDQWYCSPQTDVFPTATAACLHLWKQSGEAKRMVRKHCAAWQFYSSFAHLVSIKIAIFGVNTCSMVLQTTDRFLPHPNCLLLEFITTEWGGKNNGEKQLSVFNFSYL